MRTPGLSLVLTAVVAAALSCSDVKTDLALEEKSKIEWEIHDMKRPQPPVVDPGAGGPPVQAPSDALVLFGGTDLSQWRNREGQPAGWKIENGTMVVAKGTGLIKTVKEFGDCQLHLEWATPVPEPGGGKLWGNSGVFFMEKYEIQVLDSVNNTNYADGIAAAVYGQHPPLVNACRSPGEWQTFDIIFHRPHFDSEGNCVRPARMTVIHNNILVQDNVVLTGPTDHGQRPPYQAHPDRLPLSLQNYEEPVRFRNIWIREIDRRD